MVDVVVGAWRNALSKALASEVASVEERRDKGFRLLPYESTVSELALILDGYDAFAQDILTEDLPHGEELPFSDMTETPVGPESTSRKSK